MNYNNDKSCQKAIASSILKEDEEKKLLVKRMISKELFSELTGRVQDYSSNSHVEIIPYVDAKIENSEDIVLYEVNTYNGIELTVTEDEIIAVIDGRVIDATCAELKNIAENLVKFIDDSMKTEKMSA